MDDSRLKYEDALANLNKGGLTGNTLAMAQDNLKNYYAASPGATSPTPTAITTPQNQPQQNTPVGSTGSAETPAAPKNTSYDNALNSYLDALQGSNRANEASDSAAIAARRGYLDTLDAPGGLKSGAQESAARFSRNANSSLADLGVAQNAASNASNVALERLKFEQSKLPKPGEAFNLSPGQSRFDASGKQIASLPDNPSISEQYGSGAVGEYNFAKSQGYTGSFSQYQNEDANRKARAVSAANDSGLSTTAQVNAMKTTLKTGIAPSGVQIGNPVGPDGYVDPGVYLTLYQNWPGTTSDFLSKFPVKNVNPASYGLLPEALRPKGSGRSI